MDLSKIKAHLLEGLEGLFPPNPYAPSAKRPTTSLIWSRSYFLPVTYEQKKLMIGKSVIALDKPLILAKDLPAIDPESLILAREQYNCPSNPSPPLGLLVFDVTGEIGVLDAYFPLLKTLSPHQTAEFHRLTEYFVNHPKFNIGFYKADRKEHPREELPPSLVYVLAGQLVEVFYFRQDILDYIFTKKFNVRLFQSFVTYQIVGKYAGNACYVPLIDSICMPIERIYEGLFTAQAGVVAYFHELAHLLDFHSQRGSRASVNEGLIPGLDPTDGDMYVASAREKFVEGKGIEVERYEAIVKNPRLFHRVIPTGSPYVMQNDTEFIAGFLELFFRAPSYFYLNNPTLYEAFCLLLKQDPRKYRDDFVGYINHHINAYQLSDRLHLKPTGIKHHLK